MMYNSKLVASIKANGKVLREFKDTVYIPFASEYSILLKNLNTVRALVNIYIDGKNVVEGGLVLNAGQELDLERSILNNNLKQGNKFKFIERTGAVEAHRGVKLEDGIVRIEYQFEKVYPPLDYGWYRKHTFAPTKTWFDDYYGPRYSNSVDGGIMRSSVKGMSAGPSFGSTLGGSPLIGSSASNNVSYDVGTLSAQNAIPQNATDTSVENDAGITVAGSKSEQEFQTVSGFTTETEKYSIVLKLLGETESNKPVLKPVTVKNKPKCTTCGRVNKAHAKFCTECGTALEIFA